MKCLARFYSFQFEFVYIRTASFFSFYDLVTITEKQANVFAFSPVIMDMLTY